MSGSNVVLDDVDDYLAPSQACINPLFQPPEEKEGPKKKNGVVVPQRRRKVRRNVNANVNANVNDDNELKPPSPKTATPVKASIVDCLACSGCVTTAETVMLEQRHSLNSLRQRLEETRGQPRAITLSPNSLADMCRHWQVSPVQLYRPLTTLLHEVLQATVVIDGNLPLRWTWADEAQEFVDLYENPTTNSNGKTKPSTPKPSSAEDSERTTYYYGATSETVENAKDSTPPHIPLVSGTCPALVCLVEKTLSHMVPSLSQSQSPMTRMGTLLKEDGVVWDHWAVMPCHDKKLEASRPDFIFPSPKRLAVDLVITTKELIELMEEWMTQNHPTQPNVADYLNSLPPAEELVLSEPNEFPKSTIPTRPTWITTTTITDDNDDKLHKKMASSSGGHADFIFSFAAKQLFDCKLDTVQWQSASLATTAVKSARLAKQEKQHSYQAQLYRQEDASYSQTPTSGEPVLNFGIAHGMQTMQRALKHLADNDSRHPIHYLEAMACPGGCVNGGGAPRTSQQRETPSETRKRVGMTLESLAVPEPPSAPCPPRRTRYHVVPPMQYTIGATAGVKVQDMQW